MKHMKTKLTLLVIGSSLMLAAPVLPAQNANTPILEPQAMSGNNWCLGEQCLLPPDVKDELNLTDEQKGELKPIEADFANTSRQYQLANQPRIDAAQEANRQACAAKDAAQIQAARKQMQAVWVGLQSYRVAAVNQIKPLLTPAQLMILEDPKNQWCENHAVEANDPSAK
jgi:Spy/CpxP family protein refolding chaperone